MSPNWTEKREVTFSTFPKKTWRNIEFSLVHHHYEANKIIVGNLKKTEKSQVLPNLFDLFYFIFVLLISSVEERCEIFRRNCEKLNFFNGFWQNIVQNRYRCGYFFMVENNSVKRHFTSLLTATSRDSTRIDPESTTFIEGATISLEIII